MGLKVYNLIELRVKQKNNYSFSGHLREKLFKELNYFRINNEINSESVLLLKRKYNSLLISSKESLESLKKEEQIVSKKLQSIEDSINKKVSEINTKKWCSDCNQLLTNDNQYYCCLSANYCSFEHKINHWHYHYIQCVRFNNNNNNDYNNRENVSKF